MFYSPKEVGFLQEIVTIFGGVANFAAAPSIFYKLTPDWLLCPRRLGVGSDLDLVAIVVQSATPFERRALAWDLSPLPVPAELLVYTGAEWRSMQAKGGRFARMLAEEVVWVWG